MTPPLSSKKTLAISSHEFTYYSLDSLELASDHKLSDLPFSLRPVLEGVLRHADRGEYASKEDVNNLFPWQPEINQIRTIPFFPGRILLQDFTGVPVMNDLASMRAQLQREGGNPADLQPGIPVDLVIDHSVQLDYAGFPGAFSKNVQREYERNHERYAFLRWCQNAFEKFRVVPPAKGIVHQINLEYLARLVLQKNINGETVLIPDTLLGTDSHTTMINGLGVAGWGVGGLEALAAMLGQPVEIVVPEVIGFELTGRLKPGVTPTDLTLRIVHMLRQNGVVGKFVEFFGEGMQALALANRAMIANMTPESGATMLYFPIDGQTLDYLRSTGRPDELIDTVRAYLEAQQMLYTSSAPIPRYTHTMHLDMESIRPGLAGPRRPQDFIALSEVRKSFRASLSSLVHQKENGKTSQTLTSSQTALAENGKSMQDGVLAIAAITSCTNTSNPTVMLAAGLLAQNAVNRGLQVPPYVKTSLTPGSRVVTDMLATAGLIEPLEELGFHVAAYGCATCIGNTGPLHPQITEAVRERGVVAASILSGNRNFEGRISPDTLLNYLASPPLVVAYALAGSIDIDLSTEPLGVDRQGKPVFLSDLWPEPEQITKTLNQALEPNLFNNRYEAIFEGDAQWNALPAGTGLLYQWKQESNYLKEVPYFSELVEEDEPGKYTGEIHAARILALFGDSITTDHISPAGNIPVGSMTGKYLREQGVANSDLNTYGARRGNHEVMMRGTFANPRLKNLLAPGTEGSVTIYWPEEQKTSIYEAAMQYRSAGIPLVIIAGKEYGTGSSRDWAAKGPALLGVKAVIAQSFERIHRSNLAGMGILPLEFEPGVNACSLNLCGDEIIHIPALPVKFSPGNQITIWVQTRNGERLSVTVTVRLDTQAEVISYQHGGILNRILTGFLKKNPQDLSRFNP